MDGPGNLVNVIPDTGELPQQRWIDACNLVHYRDGGVQAMLAHPRGQAWTALVRLELIVLLVSESNPDEFLTFRLYGNGRVSAVLAGGKGGRSIPLYRSQSNEVNFVYPCFQ